MHLGESRRAIGYHEQALEINRRLGYRLGEREDLVNLEMSAPLWANTAAR
jgi:hypothetical protein